MHPLVVPIAAALLGGIALVIRAPEYGIAGVVALAPLTNLTVAETSGSTLATPAKPFHLLIPALAFALFAYGVIAVRGERRRRSNWFVISLFVLVGSSLVSSAQALDPEEAVTKVVLLVSAAAVALTVLQVAHERRQLVVVTGGALLGLMIAAAHGLTQTFAGTLGDYRLVAEGDVVTRVQGAFGHPNSYAGYLALLIPLAGAIMLVRSAPYALRWLGGISLVLALPALAYTFTRGAIVGLVVGVLAWLTLVRPRLVPVVGAAIGVIALTLVPGALRERFEPEQGRGDVPIRADIWSASIAIYSDHPILGVGVNNFANAYERLPSTLDNAAQRRYLNQGELQTPTEAQNLYLNVLAEQGIVGAFALILFFGVAVGVVYRGSHVEDPLGRAVCLGTGAGLAAFALHNVLDVTFLTELSLPLFGLVGVAAVFVSLDVDEPDQAGLPEDGESGEGRTGR